MIDGIFNILLGVPIPAQTLLIYHISRLPWIKKIHTLSLFQIGLIVITLNTIVHISITILNHIKFSDKGQIEAAYALGMDDKQAFKHVIFLPAFKKSKISILSQFIVNFQNTALISVIGFVDIMKIAERSAFIDSDFITPYIIVSLLYVVLIVMSKSLLKYIEKRQLIRKKSKLFKK